MTAFSMKLKGFFKKYENLLYPLLSFGLIIAVWAIYAKSVNLELIMPMPSVAFKRFFGLLAEKSFWTALGSTLWRTVYSFFIAYFGALILAVLGVTFKPLHKLLEPIITVLRATPTMSVILLAIIWFKSSKSPVFIAFLIVFPLCYAAFYGAISAIDSRKVEMSRLYAVKKSDVITRLYIPAVAPTLFSTAKSNLSLNVKIVISAEVLAQTAKSIGNNMQLARIYLDTAELMAWTIAAVLMSFLLEGIITVVKKLTVRW